MQRLLPLQRLNVAVALVILGGALVGLAAVSPVLAQLPQQDAATLPSDGDAGTGLPPNYTPPKPQPPVMDDANFKPLMTEAEYNQLRKDTIGYSKILRNGIMNREAISKWAKMQVYYMADPEARKVVTPPVKHKALQALKNKDGEVELPPENETVADRRIKLQRELATVGRLAGDPDDAIAFRRYVNQQVVDRATELLNQHFLVRLNAAWLLAEMDVADNRAYAGAYKPLIAILKAPTGGGLDQQTEAVKIVAARGLARIALTASMDLQINEKQAIAEALIAELQDPQANGWYQQALIEALGNVDLVNAPGNNKPFLLDTLGTIMTDENRTLCVRAEAAKAIGRIPLPQGVNMDTLVYRIVHLAQEMAKAQRLAPMNPQWPGCFAKLYLAFHPANERERELYRSRGAGLLEKQPQASIVQEGFKQIVPLVSHTQMYRRGLPSGPQKLPDQTVAALATWLSKNRPSSNKLAPYLDDLPSLDQPKAAAVSANGVE